MNIYPKKLPLTEMWKLYNLIGKGTRKQYLLDEITEMLQSISPLNIKKSLEIMYDTVSITNPLMVSLMFTKGLKHNHYFEFVDFVDAINGRQ